MQQVAAVLSWAEVEEVTVTSVVKQVMGSARAVA